MNIEKEIDEILEILDNQKRRALKSSNAAPEYSYGQIGALKIAIGLVRDLKKKLNDNQSLPEQIEELIEDISSVQIV